MTADYLAASYGAPDEYTPTTEDVREKYKSGAWLRADDQESAWKPEVYAPRYYAEFDRWLAQHDAEVQAQAWEEGHRHRPRRGPTGCTCAAWSEG